MISLRLIDQLLSVYCRSLIVPEFAGFGKKQLRNSFNVWFKMAIFMLYQTPLLTYPAYPWLKNLKALDDEQLPPACSS